MVKNAFDEARGLTSFAGRCALISSCSMVLPRLLRSACESTGCSGSLTARAGVRRADARQERLQPWLALARSPEQAARSAAAALRRQPWANNGSAEGMHACA